MRTSLFRLLFLALFLGGALGWSGPVAADWPIGEPGDTRISGADGPDDLATKGDGFLLALSPAQSLSDIGRESATPPLAPAFAKARTLDRVRYKTGPPPGSSRTV